MVKPRRFVPPPFSTYRVNEPLIFPSLAPLKSYLWRKEVPTRSQSPTRPNYFSRRYRWWWQSNIFRKYLHGHLLYFSLYGTMGEYHFTQTTRHRREAMYYLIFTAGSHTSSETGLAATASTWLTAHGVKTPKFISDGRWIRHQDRVRWLTSWSLYMDSNSVSPIKQDLKHALATRTRLFGLYLVTASSTVLVWGFGPWHQRISLTRRQYLHHAKFSRKGACQPLG